MKKLVFILRNIIIICIVLWFLSSMLYLCFFRDDYNARLEDMSKQLDSIEVLKQYDKSTVQVASSRSIISKSMYLIIYDNKEKCALESVRNYLNDNGWKVIGFYSDRMDLEKGIYLLTMVKGEGNKWYVYMHINDIFYKLKL